jgi:hypothetical protein
MRVTFVSCKWNQMNFMIRTHNRTFGHSSDKRKSRTIQSLTAFYSAILCCVTSPYSTTLRVTPKQVIVPYQMCGESILLPFPPLCQTRKKEKAMDFQYHYHSVRFIVTTVSTMPHFLVVMLYICTNAGVFSDGSGFGEWENFVSSRPKLSISGVIEQVQRQ